jgi:hypothetical protein
MSRKNADRVRRSELCTAAILYFDISEGCLLIGVECFAQETM